MAAQTLTLELDAELANALLTLAERRHRRPLDLLRQLVRDELALSYDDWFRREVENAIRQADDASARVYSSEEVKTIMSVRRYALEKAEADA